MRCQICESAAGIGTRIEFLPSEKRLELPLCDGCMRELAATQSINIYRIDSV